MLAVMFENARNRLQKQAPATMLDPEELPPRSSSRLPRSYTAPSLVGLNRSQLDARCTKPPNKGFLLRQDRGNGPEDGLAKLDPCDDRESAGGSSSTRSNESGFRSFRGSGCPSARSFGSSPEGASDIKIPNSAVRNQSNSVMSRADVALACRDSPNRLLRTRSCTDLRVPRVASTPLSQDAANTGSRRSRCNLSNPEEEQRLLREWRLNNQYLSDVPPCVPMQRTSGATGQLPINKDAFRSGTANADAGRNAKCTTTVSVRCDCREEHEVCSLQPKHTTTEVCLGVLFAVWRTAAWRSIRARVVAMEVERKTMTSKLAHAESLCEEFARRSVSLEGKARHFEGLWNQAAADRRNLEARLQVAQNTADRAAMVAREAAKAHSAAIEEVQKLQNFDYVQA